MMGRFKQIWKVGRYNFSQWRSNPRIFVTFALAFILCFLLSDKAVRFARENGTIMQAAEAFVWTFGDANSILLSSLLLALLFVDMPFITPGTPFFLMRTRRSVWVMGQVLYILLATFLYLLFILLSTCLICAEKSFIGNKWSETAAILGYSGAGKSIALPAVVKTLELSTPYGCTAQIFLLMLFYTLTMVMIMFAVNLRRGQFSGILSVFIFSLFGLLLQPGIFQKVFAIPDPLIYKANVAVGWLSPLNHATYHMHNFGYDLLPRLWQTYAVFGVFICLLIWAAVRGARQYNFQFTGTNRR